MFTKTTMYCKFMLSDDGDYIMCICIHVCMYVCTYLCITNESNICNESFNFKCPYVRFYVNIYASSVLQNACA
jgi:hypothetical protein